MINIKTFNTMEKTLETVKDRLLHFLKSENVSHAEFARKMGVSVAYVSAIRKSIPEEKVKKMTELFPTLNRDWLLYGEGDMYRPAEEPACRDEEGYLVPLLPVEAFAGNLQNYSRGVMMRDCAIIASPVKGADFAIQISGDSMEPQIHNGTYAAICRINEQAFIPWGNPMIIDSENGVLVKVVYPSERGDEFIEAHSYNSKYPSLLIPKRSIFGLYRIVAFMQRVSTM